MTYHDDGVRSDARAIGKICRTERPDPHRRLEFPVSLEHAFEVHEVVAKFHRFSKILSSG